MNYEKIIEIIGEENKSLLAHRCTAITKDKLQLPSPTFVADVFEASNRSIQTLKSIAALFHSGRLSGTGYLSVLPVDQGIEHTAGASFAPNPIYFDPENIVRLAMEGGCNAVASTYGVLGAVAS